ncbi:response regulator [Paraburkholderia phenoliruptrix]|uniref:response regulator n=1 Tax=Paraburkholderia phenoliruptrix TaxID=252970 RepID=UPI001C6EB279|nr:response regulator [Paraburkholderia phenoliruptrix]MBW9132946.1 response regulator [Paraburkholderia ginsengiterrae]
MKVLVVDDYAEVADSLAELLRAYGHEVETAYSGCAAVAEGESWVPDLILMDVRLGGEDGCKVCKTMRSKPALSSCRIVAMSGWEDDESGEWDRVFDGVLKKPIRLEVLENVLSGENVPRASH